jgi:chromosome transmission fidelity protein 1
VNNTNTSKFTSASSSSNSTGKGGNKGCPFIDTASQEIFRDRLLAGLRDVEEAAELGWTAGTCAYYGSRKAVKYAEVVAMPYSMLLHSGTRTASGIEPHLKGSVVVIDEAHNIIDAINSTHASLVTHQQLVVSK